MCIRVVLTQATVTLTKRYFFMMIIMMMTPLVLVCSKVEEAPDRFYFLLTQTHNHNQQQEKSEIVKRNVFIIYACVHFLYIYPIRIYTHCITYHMRTVWIGYIMYLNKAEWNKDPSAGNWNEMKMKRSWLAG